MATESEILELRGLIQESENVAPWTDEFLGGLIDRYGIRKSASSIWKQKAASYVELVSISEGGSSRSNGEVHKNAMAMVKMFDDEDEEEAKTSGRSQTRRIVRG